MSATQRWKRMIEEEHAQSDRMRGPVSPTADHWTDYAQQFRADPRRTDDPLVDRLSQKVASHHTVIDVGAGGGRLALPLALRCRQVVAVEPSESMASVLLQQASDHGIHNISLVKAGWEEAEVEAGDVVLCAHVLYTVGDIEHFVRKLEAHARERVIIVMYKAPPQSQLYPLWKQIHGEERLPLPSLSEFEDVLSELGVEAQQEMLPPQPPRGFDSLQQAMEQLARRLYLKPGTQKMGLLESTLPDLLEEVNGVFTIRGARPLGPGLVCWHPASSGR